MKTASPLPETFLVFTILALPLQAAEPDAATSQHPAKLDRAIKVQMGYLLYLPQGYAEKKAWPLLVFLHGVGERGDNLELVKKHGPPKLIEAGNQFPFVVVSPQCPDTQWWQPVEVATLIDEIVEEYKIDEDRVYLTGLSMGGFGTWATAAYIPNRLAAIVPVCGGGETYRTRDFSRLPTWAFHGAKDSVVPVKRSEEMVQALKKRGDDAKLTVYPEAGHDSWTETYENPEVYEWLLSHKRGE